VAGHRFPQDQVTVLQQIRGTTYLGKVEADPAVQEADWAGRSLLDLPEDSPACVSVRAILGKVGYEVAD